MDESRVDVCIVPHPYETVYICTSAFVWGELGCVEMGEKSVLHTFAISLGLVPADRWASLGSRTWLVVNQRLSVRSMAYRDHRRSL